ncbi:MAG: putative lipoic acid-binding regulatory protein [Bermanella sp.]|jgi:putative lipoic acid-binding regulatory protein
MAHKTQPPKIEFPCPNYPVKVLGQAGDDYESFVIDIMRVHAPDFDVERIKVNHSSNGRFTSITFFITATSPQQLEQLHADFIQHDRIKMVM